MLVANSELPRYTLGMDRPLNILLVAHLPQLVDVLRDVLEDAGRTTNIHTVEDITDAVSLESFDIVLAIDVPIHTQTANGLVPIVTLTQNEFQELSSSPASFERFIRYAMEKHLNTQRLAGKHLRFELAMRGSKDGLWDWDLFTDRVYWSRQWAVIMGLESTSLRGNPDEWWALIHNDDLSRVREALDAHLEGKTEHLEVEYRIRHKDTAFRWVLTRGLAIRNEAGDPTRIAGSLTDIHERKSAEQHSSYQALHDPLTGLPNRALMLDRLEHCFKRMKRNPTLFFAVLFLDLDRFKFINDSLGHWAGDQLLVEVGERLKSVVREGDTVARQSGDEFTILLDELQTHEDALLVATRIQKALTEAFHVGEQDVYVNVSIGIAFSNRAYEHANELLRDADTAMYRAKANGNAQYVVYGPGMHEQTMAHLQMETQLRTAIQNNELGIAFQPIYALPEHRLTAFEVFVRWPQPAADWISPAQFLPIAEETGLILPLGKWVFHTALQTMTSWKDKGWVSPHVKLNINLSARQFQHPNLVDDISLLLEQWPQMKGTLRLEITEKALMSHREPHSGTLDTLKQLGVTFQIDDFGTGFSSLANLAQLAVDALKIDRSFIGNLTSNHKNEKIVRAIVTLAQNLGISVTAEGIETQGQLDIVQELGCDEVQGYFFSKPMDAASVEATLFDS